MYEIELKLPDKIHTVHFYNQSLEERDKLLTAWRFELQRASENVPRKCSKSELYSIAFVFRFSGQVFSVTDCFAMVDLLLKAMVEEKIFYKESPRYVPQINIIPMKSDREYSYCSMELN